MNKGLKYLIGFVIVLVVLLIINPFVKIDAGERGVILNWGKVSDQVLDEGLHFRTPIVQKIKKIDVTVQKVEAGADAASKDLQTVTTDIALNYSVDPQFANKVYQTYRNNHVERVILPAIQEKVKATTAQYTAEELITKRTDVKGTLKSLISERLAEAHLLVDDISITNFSFSEGFDAAIEAKQTAEQDALKAENELRRIKIEAEQKVATAQAEAEAIRIQAQAVTQQGGKDYVQLKAIEQWDGKLPTQMIPGATVPFIDLTR